MLFHTSINAAIKAAKKGHKISILPGLYSCTSLEWIENDVEIEGLSDDRCKTILQCASDIEVFLHCSDNVTIRNLTLTCQKSLDCILMVHSGQTVLHNCRLDAANCTKSSFVVLSRGKLKLEKTLEIKPFLAPSQSETKQPQHDEATQCDLSSSEDTISEIEKMENASSKLPPSSEDYHTKEGSDDEAKSFEFVSM